MVAPPGDETTFITNLNSLSRSGKVNVAVIGVQTCDSMTVKSLNSDPPSYSYPIDIETMFALAV